MWPAARQLGLPGPAALAVRCLAGVADCLAQGRLKSRLWPAAADWLFIHPCLPCDGPGGTQTGSDLAHFTEPRIKAKHMFHLVGQEFGMGILPGWQSTLSTNKQETENRNTIERSFSTPCWIHSQSVVTSPLALRIVARLCFCFRFPV